MKGPTRIFENAVWHENAKRWHERHMGQAHHSRGREGGLIACLGLIVPAGFNHHEDREFIKRFAEGNREAERAFLAGYRKGEGCLRRKDRPDLFRACAYCAMPRIDDETGEPSFKRD